MVSKRRTSLLFGAVFLLVLSPILAVSTACALEFDTAIFTAAAVGLLVNEMAPQIDRAVNTLTFNAGVPVGTSTKVVPIVSVGEKGYVGAAQVFGPDDYVKSTKAVWVYEDNFSQNEFRLKIYIPSASLNPLEFKRVHKVGISAIIDVSVDGRWRGQTYSRSIGAGDVLKAGVIAVAINAAAEPLNRAINAVTKGLTENTKVVPIATIGDKAYIGGAQVSGSSAAVSSVQAVFQYEDVFDGGRFRIKAFVPSPSVNPLQMRRVAGVGITALIDTSIADQERIRERERVWRTYRTRSGPIEIILDDRFRADIERHDQGLHLGWYIGKGNQRKLLTGVWVERYKALSPSDQELFVIWWNAHHNEKPEVLEKRWQEWVKEREKSRSGPKPQTPQKGKGKDKGKDK